MNEPGAGVDASGNPVLDPTKNVLDLVEAAVVRLNDLREADLEHRKELDLERREHRLEVRGLQKDLRDAETARIDAIRAVDVGAVQRAAEVQADVATALANQVALSAETLRNTVSETATAGATALAQALDPLQKAIDDLRRAQYEAQGKQGQVVDSRAGLAGIYALVATFVGVIGLVITAYIATH
jgi:VIT1/CCC1 family predicted Fe2+/Mn2+ transporter